jgi:large subunit ribosomal protein L25
LADKIELTLEPREVLGKKVKRLRLSGVTPVHLYGAKAPALALQCDSATLQQVMGQAGRTAPIYVTVKGEEGEDIALIREVQREPVKGALLHVDFLRVEAAVSIATEVNLTLIGEAPGTREARGTVVQHLYRLQVEALPLDIPHELEIDLSVLTGTDVDIRAGDVPLPSKVALLSDPEALVARIEVARTEVDTEGDGDVPTGPASAKV